MNSITKQFEKNYAITKKVIDMMLIDQTNNIKSLIEGIIPMPVDNATCYIIQGVYVYNEHEVSTGFAIYNGNLVSVYGGWFTGFYAYIETPTVIEGVDSSGNPYKTEIINKKLAPATSGIAYEDMIRIELAIKQTFKINLFPSTGVNSRFAIGAHRCHITQFDTVQLYIDYYKTGLQQITVPEGWFTIQTLPSAYVPSEGIDVMGCATINNGTIIKIVPVKISNGILMFYEDNGFTTDAIDINVRLNYTL